ncbi:hypothetical protein ACFL54_09185 [Planctomycetota bacterium]
MRSLANAARMIENNPALMNLRVLRSITDVGQSCGNTLMLGVPDNFLTLMQNGKRGTEPEG